MKSFDGIRKINTKKKISPNVPISSVKDFQKRNFIKLAGIAGVGALAYSLIPKQAQALIFGSSMRTDSVGLKNIAGSQINPSTEAKQDDIITAIGGFNIPQNDYVGRGWNAGTFTEVWTFKTGGAGGTTVGTITIVYDNVDMDNIVSVTKI